MALAAVPVDQEELKRKIIWMMTLRLVIIITLLGSAILIQLVSRTILPINPLYFLIFMTSFLTLIYALGFTRMANLRLLAYLQLTGDILVITLLLYFTGGVRSSFSFLYILVIITSSILLSGRASIYAASMSTIFYGTLIDLLYYNVIPYYDLDPFEISAITTRLVYYSIFIHTFAFYSSAWMSSYLAERLRRTKTELEEMDEDLSDLKILHKKIIDSITAGLLIIDLKGEVNFVNDPGVRILNLPPMDLLGRNIQHLFQESVSLDRIVETLSRQEHISFERTFLRNSQPILVSLTASYIHAKTGVPTGFILIFQDVTESRSLERQYHLHERMAAIGTMAAGIAHEIRNPLASIRGSVQMLRDEVELNEEQRKLMEIVMTESTRLDQTIKNFLNYAKPKQMVSKTEDIKNIIEETLAFFQNGPDFQGDHRIDFQATEEEFCHDVDANQIRQVIWNLSINAMRAMPKGGTLRVQLKHDSNGNIILTFRDEGQGIAPERLDSIFDPFQSSTTGGSGLGMAIVYRIVQDHQGNISIDSSPGAGTTVTIHLPSKPAPVVQRLLQ